MIPHAKSLWFMFWVFSLIAGVIGASGIIRMEAGQKLTMGLVHAFDTIAVFLAAQWKAPAQPSIEQPEAKP